MVVQGQTSAGVHVHGDEQGRRRLGRARDGRVARGRVRRHDGRLQRHDPRAERHLQDRRQDDARRDGHARREPQRCAPRRAAAPSPRCTARASRPARSRSRRSAAFDVVDVGTPVSVPVHGDEHGRRAHDGDLAQPLGRDRVHHRVRRLHEHDARRGRRRACSRSLFTPTAYGPRTGDGERRRRRRAARACGAPGDGPRLRQLTVTKSGAGNGTISASGLTCTNNTCMGSYPRTDAGGPPGRQHHAPTPDALSIFSGWGGACTGTGGCQVTMSMAQSRDGGLRRQAGPAHGDGPQRLRPDRLGGRRRRLVHVHHRHLRPQQAQRPGHDLVQRDAGRDVELRRLVERALQGRQPGVHDPGDGRHQHHGDVRPAQLHVRHLDDDHPGPPQRRGGRRTPSARRARRRPACLASTRRGSTTGASTRNTRVGAGGWVRTDGRPFTRNLASLVAGTDRLLSAARRRERERPRSEAHPRRDGRQRLRAPTSATSATALRRVGTTTGGDVHRPRGRRFAATGPTTSSTARAA